MATAHTQADEHQPGAETTNSSATTWTDSNPPSEGQGPAHSPLEGRGLEAVSIITAALSAVGLLTIIFGVHLTPSNTVILTGTAVMSLVLQPHITDSALPSAPQSCV